MSVIFLKERFLQILKRMGHRTASGVGIFNGSFGIVEGGLIKNSWKVLALLHERDNKRL